jgi:membrane protease YdiL (CAAX protease family)
VVLWAKAIGGLLVARLVSLVEPTGVLSANLAGVAAFLFIALPDARLRARGEGWGDYGLPAGSLRASATWAALGRGARAGLLSSLLVLPFFGLVFAAYAWLLPHLAPGLARTIAPYAHASRLAFRFPPDLLLRVVLQFLVVALPEELFYRGYLQTSWARDAPGRGVVVLGARLGAGFLFTQLLFAGGHLVVFEPWRLATFLPALWFGWLRERTGGVAAPVVAHALSNLFIQTLEASFYG